MELGDLGRDIAEAFSGAVAGVPGGSSLLSYWDLGKPGWENLLQVLVALCREDRSRPLAHVVFRLENALRCLWAQTGRVYPRWSEDLAGKMFVSVVPGSCGPRAVYGDEAASFILAREPGTPEVCLLTRQVVVVGLDWIRDRVEFIVPSRSVADPPYYVLSRYPVTGGEQRRSPLCLCVRSDFLELAIMYRSRVAVPCEASVLVREAMEWPVREGDGGCPWRRYPAAVSGEALRLRVDAYAVLLAAREGCISGLDYEHADFPFLSWVDRCYVGAESLAPGLGMRIQADLNRRGLVYAFQRAVDEVKLGYLMGKWA